MHGGVKADNGGGIVRGRIVVGDRAADGAAVADMRIADAGGEIHQDGNRLFEIRICDNLGMGRSGLDRDLPAFDRDPAVLETSEVDHVTW